MPFLWVHFFFLARSDRLNLRALPDHLKHTRLVWNPEHCPLSEHQRACRVPFYFPPSRQPWDLFLRAAIAGHAVSRFVQLAASQTLLKEDQILGILQWNHYDTVKALEDVVQFHPNPGAPTLARRHCCLLP